MNVAQAVLKEMETLPESRQRDVLAFVRFLKSGLADNAEAESRFDRGLEQARRIAENRGVSDDDIRAEIEAFRTK